MKFMKYLLIFIPVSVAARLLKIDEGITFILVCLSIIPLAAAIGNATEQVSFYTGSKVGGLISATMSNIPELFIGFFAVRAGYHNLMLASMAGSVIGNTLLVLGVSTLLGGLKNEYQVFNKNVARSNFTLLFLAALSIVIPFSLKFAVDGSSCSDKALQSFSLCIAIALLAAYVSGLVFSLVTHRNIFIKHQEQDCPEEKPSLPLSKALAILAASAVFVAVESEMLVDTVEHVIANYGLSEIFIGIIVIPLLGNVAENVSAVLMAVRSKIDICIEIAIGSSIQIALFVAPLLILAGFALGMPVIYVFDLFEVVAIIAAIALSLYIFQDGKTNWLEGLVLVSCYFMLGAAFYFI